jgi:hypothetical protein
LVALIICISTSLGYNYGILIGFVSILITGLFFGYGLFTVFQIISIVIIAYLSAILFRHSRNNTLVCLWGVFCTLIIYKGIINIQHLVEFNRWNITFFVATYMLKFYEKVLYAICTFLLLAFFYKPICHILNSENFGVAEKQTTDKINDLDERENQ